MTIYEEELRLREPCSVPWESMHEVRGGRHCAHCGHTVREVSQMTEREVRVLIEERKRRRICIRVRVYEDGTVQTAPAKLVPTAHLLRRVRPLVLAAGAALAPACVDTTALEPPEETDDGGYEDGAYDEEEGGAPDAGGPLLATHAVHERTVPAVAPVAPTIVAAPLSSYSPDKGPAGESFAASVKRALAAVAEAAPAAHSEARPETPAREAPRRREYIEHGGF